MIRLRIPRIRQKFTSQCISHSLRMGYSYTLMQRTDISQCVTVIFTNLIEAGKDYQCSVTLFVTVSFFCYWVPVIFVFLRDLWIILISAKKTLE